MDSFSLLQASLIAQLVKNPLAGDPSSIPGSGRSPGEGIGYPLQYSGLENSMDCMVHGVTKSWTWLSDVHFPSPGDFPNPGMEPRSPALQVDSLPAKLQGKPKNTGVGSRSLLQEIFLTQESNRSLLHCRWILYQLNHQGNP